MLKNGSLLGKVTIILVVLGLGTMFFGSFSYRLSNPSLVKRINPQGARSSDFGNQGGMNTGMTAEMMSHISDLMGRLSADPENFEVRRELAEHFMDVGDWTSAVVHLQRALAVQPDDVPANYFLGVSQYSLGNFNESAQAFEHLLTIEKDPSAMFNLGILYAQHLGKTEEAKALFQEVASQEDTPHDIKDKVTEILRTLDAGSPAPATQ